MAYILLWILSYTSVTYIIPRLGLNDYGINDKWTSANWKMFGSYPLTTALRGISYWTPGYARVSAYTFKYMQTVGWICIYKDTCGPKRGHDYVHPISARICPQLLLCGYVCVWKPAQQLNSHDKVSWCKYPMLHETLKEVFTISCAYVTTYTASASIY